MADFGEDVKPRWNVKELFVLIETILSVCLILWCHRLMKMKVTVGAIDC